MTSDSAVLKIPTKFENQSYLSELSLLTQPNSKISRIEGSDDRSYVPELSISYASEKVQKRQQVQDYAGEMRDEFAKIDTHNRGIIDKDDLSQYIADPKNVHHREAAKFLLENYDFISHLAYDPPKPGNELFKGYGISRSDLNLLEGLTDPEKFRSVVRWEAAAESLGVAAGFGTFLVGAGIWSGIAVSGASWTAIIASGVAIGVASIAGAAAVGVGVALGAGYLFYQRKVREHYSEKRTELEKRLNLR